MVAGAQDYEHEIEAWRVPRPLQVVVAFATLGLPLLLMLGTSEAEAGFEFGRTPERGALLESTRRTIDPESERGARRLIVRRIERTERALETLDLRLREQEQADQPSEDLDALRSQRGVLRERLAQARRDLEAFDGAAVAGDER